MNEKDFHIKKLFVEKKYSELILFIENEIKIKSSRYLNILGAARLLKEKSTDAFRLALNEFKLAYLNEKNSDVGFEGLINYINATVDFYDILNEKRLFNEHDNFFDEPIKFFKEANEKTGYNSKLIYSIARVFKRQHKFKETSYYYSLLFKNNDLNLTSLSSWIFFNNYLDNWNQQDYFRYSKLLNEYCNIYSVEDLNPIVVEKKKKIRIAFLSSDIRIRHPITYFLKSVLKNCNNENYEIYLFLNDEREDNTTEEFKQLVYKYFFINHLNDLEVINLVRKQKIDVIFDIMGLTSSFRISLFKNRLAPIQINWMGHHNTSGLYEMDYLIADKHLILPEEEKYFTEKILFMPDIWICHSGFDFERNFLDPPCKKNNFFTFGSFNNFAKINKKVISVWSNILKKVTKSKLILKSSTNSNIQHMKKIFKENEVLDSVIFLDNEASYQKHLNLYNKIDVVLDTFPYNGVTTSFEALWMGVPIITMKGFHFNSRCGESINKNIGLEELISNNEIDYYNKALEISSDRNYFFKIKKKLITNIYNSPLFNAENFSNNFFILLKKLLEK